jgi:rhamnose transport system ATP-binding protein
MSERAIEQGVDGLTGRAHSSAQIVLNAAGINKTYGATRALSDVSLELCADEVHCLLGENGAGKSTLVKIIAGLERQDSGVLLIRGKEMEAPSVKAARAAGVGVVYQHPVVFPEIDVTENIYAGRQMRRGRCRAPNPG